MIDALVFSCRLLRMLDEVDVRSSTLRLVYDRVFETSLGTVVAVVEVGDCLCFVKMNCGAGVCFEDWSDFGSCVEVLTPREAGQCYSSMC